MNIKKVSVKVYPASVPSDMKEWVNPSTILTAEVSLGECDEYGCDDSVISISDHSGYEIYRNNGDINKDTKKMRELYDALGWKEEYHVYSLFEVNNGYGFIARAREE